MAHVYATTSPASMAAFASDLFSFASTNGWTIDDDATASPGAMNNGTTYVQMTWATSNVLALYQSTGYTGAGPGAETNDSGSGGTADTQRALHLPSGQAGPYTSAHFFTDDSASPTYIHAVLEYQPGLFRHMTFGEIVKVGDWTGGSYCCGHFWDQAAANIDNASDVLHSVPFECSATGNPDQHGTLHIEGMPNQNASGKWGVIWGGTSPANDTAAVARINIFGGMRDGPLMNSYGWIPSNPQTGKINMVPLPLFYRNTTASDVTLLGYAPDIRYVNMTNLTPNSDYTVGSQTWRVFPLVRKQFLENDTEESWNAGIAYRKA